MLHRLQRRGVVQQSGDTIEQLAIRNQSADVVALQKSDVESFLTAERTRREQRPAARERFRDTDAARLADDHIRRAQIDVHAIGPLAYAQALGILAREHVERLHAHCRCGPASR